MTFAVRKHSGDDGARWAEERREGGEAGKSTALGGTGVVSSARMDSLFAKMVRSRTIKFGLTDGRTELPG